MIKQILNGQWKLKRTDEAQWMTAAVPGSVFYELLSQGKMEDPFYRDNEETIQRYADHDYEYQRTFVPDSALLEQDKVMLRCEGLDTLCDVFLNGKKILHGENMHRTYEVEVKEALNEGENTLRIQIYNSLAYIKERQKNNRLWNITEPIDGFPQIRKGHYMYGWDWGPQVPDLGIWRDISLVGYQYGRLDDVYLTQQHQKGTVTIDVRIRTESWSGRPLTASVLLIAPDGTVERKTAAAKPETMVSFVAEEPALWWPNGYGKQPLYRVDVRLEQGGVPIDEHNYRIGLRSIEVKRQKDQWGESFGFVVNGAEIFSMGADYIPEDNLLPRCSFERTKKLLEDCVRANFNTVRVWGGGLYPENYFFDLCDEMGLLVWHDFMFACAVYELDKEFQTNITQEIKDNVTRIRHHACLALWCGNNEMEEAWNSWGLDAAPKLKTDYIKQNEVLFPDLLDGLDPNTFYWPSSPSSGGGFDTPNDFNRGDVHYWEVWHGKKPFTDYRNYFFRYASEFGFQSFPCLKTVKTYTQEEDRNIFSYVMERHQKCNSANGTILYYLSDTFLLPKDFDSLLYASQILQAEAIKYGVEHWRSHKERCRGAIYWQLNDCWPVASWASIDYFGRWKALHYFAKNFFVPVLLAAAEGEQTAQLYVGNETRKQAAGTILWRLCKNDGAIVRSGEKEFTVPALESALCESLDFSEILQDKPARREHYLEFELRREGQPAVKKTVLFCKPKHFKFLAPEITAQVHSREDGYEILIQAQHYARYVELDFENMDARFSDNYFDVSPNMPQTVFLKKQELSLDADAEQVSRELKIRSLFDIAR